MMNVDNSILLQSIRVRIPQILSSVSPIQRMDSDFSCNCISDGCKDELMIQNYSNFKRSGSPMRIMFYEGESWINFPRKVVDVLQSEFRENPIIVLTIARAKYVFDFLRMVQIDLVSGNQRSIAWIDENAKCFFPLSFLAGEEFVEEELENSESQTIEIDWLKGKRKRETLNMGGRDAEVNNTKKQRLTSQVLEVSKWPNAKLMTEKTNIRFSTVSNMFLSAITKVDRGATITAIYQCLHSGPIEKARLEVFQRQNEITKAARGSSNTVYSWFAASAENVTGILTHGFGLHCNASGLPAYGVGVHLSPVGLPQLSAMQSEVDNHGEKHIILCRVILGNVEKVDAGSQQRGPSSEDFDTGADDPNDPKWYVVWSTKMNTHILPQYVVSYKPSARVTGQGGVVNCTKFSLPKILSKMETRLPSSQLQQVLAAYATFKAGKITRETFIQQLRAFAGDQVIMSIIREIQSSE